MSTQYTVFWCFFHAFAGIVHDVVHSSRSCQDPCVLCPSDPQAERILSVCCSKFDLQISILNWWWNVNWLHIRRDKCTRRNCSELIHCLVMKDQWDCVLNDLEELGNTQLFWKNQDSAGIFSYFLLLLLPSFSSTFRQTNDDSTRNVSEDYFFSRIQSLHHCLEVSFQWRRRWINFIDTEQSDSDCFPGLTSVQVLSLKSMVLVDALATSRFCGFAFAFVRHAKSFASSCNAYSSSWTSGISVSLSIKSVTNLFRPWEILTHEWELSLFTDIILISTPYLPCRQQVATSNTGPILVFPRIQPFGSDASSSLGKVYSRHPTASVNCEKSSVSFVMKCCPTSTTVRNPASVQNLLNLSCCDNFSIRSPYLCNSNSLSVGSSLFKGTLVLITCGTNEELDCSPTAGLHRSIMIGFIFFTHVCDCSVKTELIYRSNVRKTVSIVPSSAQKCIDNFPPPLLLSWPLDNGLVARKTGCPFSASVIIIFSAILPHSPCGLSSLIEYHFSLNQDREKTIVLLRIFLQKEKRVEHLIRILSCCLSIPMRCHWTSTWW